MANLSSDAVQSLSFEELRRNYNVVTCQQEIQVAKQVLAELQTQHEKFQTALDSPEQGAEILKSLSSDVKQLRERVEKNRKQEESIRDLLKLNAKVDTTQQEKLQNVLDKLRSDKGIFLGQLNNHRRMMKDILIPRKKRDLKKTMQALKADTESRVEDALAEQQGLQPKLEANLPAFKVCMDKLGTLQDKFDKRQVVLDDLNSKKADVQRHDDKAMSKVRSMQKKRDAQAEVFAKVRKTVQDGRRELAAAIALIEKNSSKIEATFQKTLDALAVQIAELRARLAEMAAAEQLRVRNEEELVRLRATRDAKENDDIPAALNTVAAEKARVSELLEELEREVGVTAAAAAAAAQLNTGTTQLQAKLEALLVSMKEREVETQRLAGQVAAIQAQTADVEKLSMSSATAALMSTHQQSLAAKMALTTQAEKQFKSRWQQLKEANERAVADKAAAKAVLQAKLNAQLEAAAAEKRLAAEAELEALVSENSKLENERKAIDKQRVTEEALGAEDISEAAGEAQRLQNVLHEVHLQLRMRREQHMELFGDAGRRSIDTKRKAEEQAQALTKRKGFMSDLQVRVLETATSLENWSVGATKDEVGATEMLEKLQHEANAAVVENHRTIQLVEIAREEFVDIEAQLEDLRVSYAQAIEDHAASLEEQQIQHMDALKNMEKNWKQSQEQKSSLKKQEQSQRIAAENDSHAEELANFASMAEEQLEQLQQEIISVEEEMLATTVARNRATEALNANRKEEGEARLQHALATASSEVLGIADSTEDTIKEDGARNGSSNTAFSKSAKSEARRQGSGLLRDILASGLGRSSGETKTKIGRGRQQQFIAPTRDLVSRLKGVHSRMKKAFPGAADLTAVRELEAAIGASSMAGSIRAQLQTSTAEKLQGLFRARRVRNGSEGGARTEYRGARILQSFWRGHRERSKYLIRRNAHRREVGARHMQSMFRMYRGKVRVIKLRRDLLETDSATRLQALWRRATQKKMYAEMLRQRDRFLAAAMLQKNWRRKAARKKLVHLREANMSEAQKAARRKKINAAIALQAIVRSRNVRRAAAIAQLQRIVRGRVQMKKFRFKKFFKRATGSASSVQMVWRRQVINFIADDAADMLVLLKQHDDDTGFQWLKHRSDFLEEVHQRTAKTVSATDSEGRRIAQTVAAAKFVMTTLKIKAKQMDGSIDGDAAALMVLMKEWKDIIKGDLNFKFSDFSVTKSIENIRRHADDVPQLFRLARSGNTEDMFKYMNSGESIAVNRVDDNGCTALHVAVFLGWEAVMELLIHGPKAFQEKHRGKNFCDVEKATPDGFTPLMIAAKEGHGHAVEILLEAGANILAVMPVVNSSPIYFLAQLGHAIAFQSVFHEYQRLSKKWSSSQTTAATSVVNLVHSSGQSPLLAAVGGGFVSEGRTDMILRVHAGRLNNTVGLRTDRRKLTHGNF
eukprot:INCI4063.1.p1 GENE.INCI4063.1~~INCI4063.1.p1  ORF type:complete len:1433 (+),score=382.43 INCI4063.1:104-4402(+)